MLARGEIERGVALQARGYRLIKWLEKAMVDGFIAPETAHRYASMEEAAYAWMDRHFLNIPPDARPPREELLAFSKLFATYLMNSFDLEEAPGMMLYSPGAHCFCPLCSWLVRAPHLRPKKLTPSDKRQAEKMKRDALRRLAQSLGRLVEEAELDALLTESELREPIGLFTYANDLLARLDGVAVGPASLALWRSFAWTREGSPKPGFVLSVDQIMEAEASLIARLSAT